jgi:acetate kinase
MTAILTLNAGSSSLKLAVFDGASLACRTRTTIDIAAGEDHESALERALADLDDQAFAAIGHRIVHGGTIATARVIDDALIAELRELTPLAPLHQPHCLAGVAAARKLAPRARHVACFDTAFHLATPDIARQYALPSELRDVVAYGFHGLSYEHIVRVLPQHLGARAAGRVIAAHLGSGASMCAMRGLVPIATTMGMTPLDGLVMGTRCGSIDPGAVLYLLDDRGMSATQVRDTLYERSGLLGVSETSADMKKLLAASDHDPRAARAVELFVYRATRAIGSLAAALGGLDALVFTGGIGEHSGEIRDRIVAGSRWLGDFATLPIPADEELTIARQTLGKTPTPAATETRMLR